MIMRRLFLLVFVCSICIVGCFAQSRVTVKGQILDIDTNVPIAGVRVYVKGDTTVQTLSNTKGYFELITDGSKILFLTKKYKHSIRTVADINKIGTHNINAFLFFIFLHFSRMYIIKMPRAMQNRNTEIPNFCP